MHHLFYFTQLLTLSLPIDSTINQIPHSFFRAEDLKKVLDYHGPPELHGWGRVAHILLGYERFYDSFLALPSWHSPEGNPGEPVQRPLRKKIPAMKTLRSSSRGRTVSAHSLASQHSSNLSPTVEQSSPGRRRGARRSSQSSTSSSSYSKQALVLNISNDSSSSSNPNRPSSTMSRHKAKNLLGSLGDLPSSGIGFLGQARLTFQILLPSSKKVSSRFFS